MVPVIINGVNTNAIIDTAAQVTIVSTAVASRMQPKLKSVARFTLKGPNIGSDISAQYCENLHIHMGNNTYFSDCFVADIRDDFILGLDFMTKYDLDISLTKRSITIGSESIPMELEDSAEYIISRVIASHDSVIPPMSGMTIMAKKRWGDGQTMVFEPCEIPYVSSPNTCFFARGREPIPVMN